MPLAKSTISKKINWLSAFRVSTAVLLTAFSLPVFSQDNSPYSRYGLGDLTPSTNVNGRGMGSISAGSRNNPYSNDYFINYANPASYSSFFGPKEPTGKRMAYGRVILDAGINLENRMLREPNTTEKFTASNFLFSHVQVGLPLRPNWGMSFGLRPISRISYKMLNAERLYDPNTGLPIDSSQTLSQGDGGAYLPNIGTGFQVPMNRKRTSWLAIGATVGYLFGEKNYSTRRTFINDTVSYNPGNYQTTTNYNNLVFTGGLQYITMFRHASTRPMTLTIGAYGNMKRDLKASADIIRETFYYDENTGYVRLDSVAVQRDIKGKITYPGSFTAGFTLEQNSLDMKSASWLVGIDYVQNQWDDYRYYGEVDPTVRTNWQIRVGAQLLPAFKRNYFSNVRYRVGFFTGPDYVYVQNKTLSVMGFTAGFGLPLFSFNQISQNQRTFINLAFEYIKRGNDENLLKENLFRLSAGLALSDLWFIKKKYN